MARDFAAVALAIDHVQNLRKRAISDQMEGWRTVSFEAERVVTVGAERFEAHVSGALDRIDVSFDEDSSLKVSSPWRPGQPVWRGTVGAARCPSRSARR